MKKKYIYQIFFKFILNKDKFFLLATFIFIIGKTSFPLTYDYAPMSFNISVERVTPIEVELENNGKWELGNYAIGSKSMSKEFQIKVIASPHTRVKISCEGRSAWGKSLYINGINSSNYLRLEWKIKNPDITTDSTGQAITTILFDRMAEYGSLSGGNYLADKPMPIKIETF